MKPSETKNKMVNGFPVTFVEVGDMLFFGGDIQMTYEVTSIKNGRAYSGDIDLFELAKKEQPICLTNKEF